MTRESLTDASAVLLNTPSSTNSSSSTSSPPQRVRSQLRKIMQWTPRRVETRRKSHLTCQSHPFLLHTFLPRPLRILPLPNRRLASNLAANAPCRRHLARNSRLCTLSPVPPQNPVRPSKSRKKRDRSRRKLPSPTARCQPSSIKHNSPSSSPKTALPVLTPPTSRCSPMQRPGNLPSNLSRPPTSQNRAKGRQEGSRSLA